MNKLAFLVIYCLNCPKFCPKLYFIFFQLMGQENEPSRQEHQSLLEAYPGYIIGELDSHGTNTSNTAHEFRKSDVVFLGDLEACARAIMECREALNIKANSTTSLPISLGNDCSLPVWLTPKDITGPKLIMIPDHTALCSRHSPNIHSPAMPYSKYLEHHKIPVAQAERAVLKDPFNELMNPIIEQLKQFIQEKYPNIGMQISSVVSVPMSIINPANTNESEKEGVLGLSPLLTMPELGVDLQGTDLKVNRISPFAYGSTWDNPYFDNLYLRHDFFMYPFTTVASDFEGQIRNNKNKKASSKLCSTLISENGDNSDVYALRPCITGIEDGNLNLILQWVYSNDDFKNIKSIA